MTRIGSLFTGYGGLDMAVQSVLGGEIAWYSEIEPAACTVLAAHYPGVPNLGDITTVTWTDVEPVDVLTGGYPCQPFSHAGQRKGSDDARHLWPHIAAALCAGVLRRGGVAVFENVDGHRSLGLADVLADLAGLGMSAQWGVVRAADAGAPHGRKRVFIVAADANGERHGSGQRPRALGRVGSAAKVSRRTPSTARQEPGTRSDTTTNIDWGKYEPAIRRWESLTRPAPTPTIAGANGRPRLSPTFVEWMMGLPEGHVTGHGLSNAQALKMLGNGVVPQQAEMALRLLLGGAA